MGELEGLRDGPGDLWFGFVLYKHLDGEVTARYFTEDEDHEVPWPTEMIPFADMLAKQFREA